MPFNTRFPSFSSAFVVKSVKADPACGSDILTATNKLPLQTSGMTFCFKSSLAKCSMALIGPTALSKIGQATTEETLANSSKTNKASIFERPKPPYFLFILIPKNPISAYRPNHSSDKNSFFSSNSLATEVISFCANSLATDCNSFCSGVNEKSMVSPFKLFFYLLDL